MCTNFVIDTKLSEADELEYISKSRIKEYLSCEWRFYQKYVLGKREPENEAMRRGSDIHETFEAFYENAREYITRTGTVPTDIEQFLPDEDVWEDYRQPYIENFLQRERGRRKYLQDKVDSGEITEDELSYYWLPVEIESEAWLDDESPPWMGYADVILHAESLPTVLTDEGVVVIDFKTGDTQSEQYREKGIYLEGEFYAMLFEDEYEVAAVAGYYPKNDDLLISPLEEDRQEIIQEAVREMIAADGPEDYEYAEQPLCAWGESEEDRCPYYEDDCESTWGVPIDNKEEFIGYCEEGFSSPHIAMELGTTVDAVKYWARKLDREHQLMDM